MFGKWHLGYCSYKYTPLGRGFDTFQGRFLAIGKIDPQNVEMKANERKLVKRKKHEQKKRRVSKFCKKKEKNASANKVDVKNVEIVEK